MTNALKGHPMDLGWLPHKPVTWTYRFAKVRNPVVMQHYLGKLDHTGSPMFHSVNVEPGQTVKIVMVSRLGDVGITEDLNAETGYGARVLLDDLYEFSESPQ